MEKIELTEEQARELLFPLCISDYGVETSLARWRKAGYIKKNPVEEAEEMFNHLKVNSNWSMHGIYNDVICKQHEAIQYLKKKLNNA